MITVMACMRARTKMSITTNAQGEKCFFHRMGHDLPKLWRNAGNFEVIDEVLKSTPDVEVEVESRDPKLMRWKVVWKAAETPEVPAGQFRYQVMLQQTDKNKDCWGGTLST